MVAEILVEVIQEELEEKGRIEIIKDSKEYSMKDLLYVGSRDDYQLAAHPFSQEKVWLKDYQKEWDFKTVSI
mgnify:CR=1 FL=1